MNINNSPEKSKPASGKSDHPEKHKSMSMHANIPVWYDCCSCEAEPYWVEMMDEEKEEQADKEKPDTV